MPGVPNSSDGDRNDDLDAVFGRMWMDLRNAARAHLMRERADHTLQPTALVHEVYLKLRRAPLTDWKTDDDFVRLAGWVMRRLLIDHARRKKSAKRQVATPIGPSAPQSQEDLAVVRGMLVGLEAMSPRQSTIVHMHVFAGLTFDEIAGLVDVSRRTVLRDWTMARAWMRTQLGPSTPDPG